MFGIEYPYGSIEWNHGNIEVKHCTGGCIQAEYLTDYQSRIVYPSRHLSGEYALQLLFHDGSIGFNPELDSFSNEQEQLVLNLVDKRHPQIKVVITAALSEEGIYAQQVSISNNSAEPVTLIRACSLCLKQYADQYHVSTFRGVWAGEHMLQEEEVQRGNTLCVASSCGVKNAQEGTPAVILSLNAPAQEEAGSCLLASLCWSGNYLISFTHNAQGCGFLTMGYDFAQSPYILASGAKIDLPKAIALCSHAGKGDTTRRLHRYLRRCVIPHGSERRRTLLNSWEGVHFDITEDTLRGMIERTARLGVELFVLDDGWFGKRRDDTSSLGDWRVDTERLPEGLQPVIQHAEENGIGFGLWVEPEMISPVSELYEKHPDWAIQLPDIEATQQRHQLILNLAKPEVEDYVRTAVADILSQHPGISYVKWDCNRMITDAPHTNLYFDYICAYYRVMDALRAAFPHVTFQCCSAGGGRMDHGAAQYHEEFWLSDNTDAYDRLRMQWSASHLFPANAVGAHVTVSPNLYTGRRTELKFRFDVALAGRLGFELDPRVLTDADADEIRRRLALYRELAPLTQQGELYRLLSPYEGSDTAMLYTDGHQALVLLYTTERAFTNQHTRIRLQGIDRQITYHVQEMMPDASGKHCPLDGGTVSGAELIYSGLPIRWNRPLQSSVILLTPVDVHATH